MHLSVFQENQEISVSLWNISSLTGFDFNIMWLKQKCVPGPGTSSEPSVCDLSQTLTHPSSAVWILSQTDSKGQNGILSQKEQCYFLKSELQMSKEGLGNANCRTFQRWSAMSPRMTSTYSSRLTLSLPLGHLSQLPGKFYHHNDLPGD